MPLRRDGKSGGFDVTGSTHDDRRVLEGVDDGAAVAVEDEGLPPREDHVAPVAGLGDPDGAADGHNLEILPVLHTMDAACWQTHRVDIAHRFHWPLCRRSPGLKFWLTLKKFCGSYLPFRATRRS